MKKKFVFEMTLAVLIKNQVVTWPLAYLSLTKNLCIATNLGKEIRLKFASLSLLPFLSLRKIGRQFFVTMKKS